MEAFYLITLWEENLTDYSDLKLKIFLKKNKPA